MRVVVGNDGTGLLFDIRMALTAVTLIQFSREGGVSTRKLSRRRFLGDRDAGELPSTRAELGRKLTSWELFPKRRRYNNLTHV